MNDFISLIIGAFFLVVGLWDLSFYRKGFGGTIYPLGLTIRKPTKMQRIELLLRSLLLIVIGVCLLMFSLW